MLYELNSADEYIDIDIFLIFLILIGSFPVNLLIPIIIHAVKTQNYYLVIVFSPEKLKRLKSKVILFSELI